MSLVKPSLALAAFAAAVGLAASAGANTQFPFVALLNGAQETPPVSSPSQGVAFLTFDANTNRLCYMVSYSPLGGAETVAHIHGSGGPGQSAPILFGITPDVSPIGSPKHGCVGPLTKANLRDLRRGLLYINVHSTIAPNGEIRGQIVPAGNVRYRGLPAIPFSPSGAFLGPEMP
ncbi:MAG TPA: CHRD domain-containing protein [Candidatus Binatia bacterium]|nr:CHRD domain-containing protein [Candidatus Binatia bacterium]